MPSERQPVLIHIEGLEVMARHGLLPEEKEAEQLFRFDLELRLGSCQACVSDSIEDTVDYAAVIDEVVRTATARSFELLERLAAEVADAVLAAHPALDSVRVRVDKAAPPVEGGIGSVGVSLERER